MEILYPEDQLAELGWMVTSSLPLIDSVSQPYSQTKYMQGDYLLGPDFGRRDIRSPNRIDLRGCTRCPTKRYLQ